MAERYSITLLAKPPHAPMDYNKKLEPTQDSNELFDPTLYCIEATWEPYNTLFVAVESIAASQLENWPSIWSSQMSNMQQQHVID